jgi:RNA-binding protein PNO1
MDGFYILTFEIKDVKTLQGDHCRCSIYILQHCFSYLMDTVSRTIGRIAGHQGKTKFSIENASKTRIVLADSRISILGADENIKIAKTSIESLILGAPPGKVYNALRTVSSRMKERF